MSRYPQILRTLFPSYQYTPHGTTSLGSINSLVKSFFGVGCLALPLLFSTGGIILTTILLIGLTIVALYAIVKLTEVADLIVLSETRRNMISRIKGTKASLFETIPGITDLDILPCDRENVTMPTLSQVGMVAFGKKMFNLTNWAIVIGQFGAICAYMIFISTNISEVFGIHRYYILFGAMLPAMLLVMIPDLGKLSMAGIIGNLAYIFAICVIFYLGFSEFCCVDKNEVQLLNVSSLPILFGTLSFALEGTALIFGIRDRMAQPHTFAFNMIFSMAIIAFIYWSVGFVSYILYGVHTKSPIISSLPDGLVLSGVVKITLSLSILLTLPYQFFPITEYIELWLNCDEKIENGEYNAGDMDEWVNDSDNYKKNDNFGNSQNEQFSPNLDQNSSINNINNLPDNLSQIEKNSTQHSPSQIKFQLPQTTSDHTYDSPRDNEPLVTDLDGLQSKDDIHIVQSNNSQNNSQNTTPIIIPHNRSKYLHLIQFTILSIAVLIAILFPDFHLILALFGSLATSSLAFILPCLFWLGTIYASKVLLSSRYDYIMLSIGHGVQFLDGCEECCWEKGRTSGKKGDEARNGRNHYNSFGSIPTSPKQLHKNDNNICYRLDRDAYQEWVNVVRMEQKNFLRRARKNSQFDAFNNLLAKIGLRIKQDDELSIREHIDGQFDNDHDHDHDIIEFKNLNLGETIDIKMDRKNDQINEDYFDKKLQENNDFYQSRCGDAFSPTIGNSLLDSMNTADSSGLLGGTSLLGPSDEQHGTSDGTFSTEVTGKKEYLNNHNLKMRKNGTKKELDQKVEKIISPLFLHFPIEGCYYFDRNGDPIDVDVIFHNNLVRITQYLQDIQIKSHNSNNNSRQNENQQNQLPNSSTTNSALTNLTNSNDMIQIDPHDDDYKDDEYDSTEANFDKKNKIRLNMLNKNEKNQKINEKNQKINQKNQKNNEIDKIINSASRSNPFSPTSSNAAAPTTSSILSSNRPTPDNLNSNFEKELNFQQNDPKSENNQNENNNNNTFQNRLLTFETFDPSELDTSISSSLHTNSENGSICSHLGDKSGKSGKEISNDGMTILLDNNVIHRHNNYIPRHISFINPNHHDIYGNYNEMVDILDKDEARKILEMKKKGKKNEKNGQNEKKEILIRVDSKLAESQANFQPLSSRVKFKMSILPLLVVVVGIAASVVGVIDSGSALLEHFL